MHTYLITKVLFNEHNHILEWEFPQAFRPYRLVYLKVSHKLQKQLAYLHKKVPDWQTRSHIQFIQETHLTQKQWNHLQSAFVSCLCNIVWHKILLWSKKHQEHRFLETPRQNMTQISANTTVIEPNCECMHLTLTPLMDKMHQYKSFSVMIQTRGGNRCVNCFMVAITCTWVKACWESKQYFTTCSPIFQTN